jgi:hypothetical protein
MPPDAANTRTLENQYATAEALTTTLANANPTEAAENAIAHAILGIEGVQYRVVGAGIRVLPVSADAATGVLQAFWSNTAPRTSGSGYRTYAAAGRTRAAQTTLSVKQGMMVRAKFSPRQEFTDVPAAEYGTHIYPCQMPGIYFTGMSGAGVLTYKSVVHIEVRLGGNSVPFTMLDPPRSLNWTVFGDIVNDPNTFPPFTTGNSFKSIMERFAIAAAKTLNFGNRVFTFAKAIAPIAAAF